MVCPSDYVFNVVEGEIYMRWCTGCKCHTLVKAVVVCDSKCECSFLEGGENYMDGQTNAQVQADDIHLFRKNIDSVIQSALKLQSKIGRNSGGREISLVVTKLQEGKMWAGKILEAIGSELPAQFQDKAE